MGMLNDLLVKLGLKKAEKPKRKYVRKAPAVKKPKTEKKVAAAATASDLGSLANKPLHPMDSYLNGQDHAGPDSRYGDSHGIR